MARKKKKKVSSHNIKIFVIALIALIAGVLLFKGAVYFLTRSSYFSIKTVVMDSSLQFIQKRDLPYLMGKNIFSIDISGVQRKLHHRYPQVSELRVIRVFPDQIHIVAKKRSPFAQIQGQEKWFVLDEWGTVLSVSDEESKNLLTIKNLSSQRVQFRLGTQIINEELKVALKINKLFKESNSLSAYDIEEIDVQNISKIHLLLSNELGVVLDGYDLDRKLKVLSVVLSQGNLNWKEIKYVDLRFKEPVIGKKRKG